MFGIDDILQSTGDSNPLVKIIFFLFEWLVKIFSALTTFLFFFRFAPSIFEPLVGDSSPIMAGLAGVLVLDFAIICWGQARARHATTNIQMGIATLMLVICTIGSILTTILYLLLESAFEVGIYADGGQLTDFGQMIHYFGLGVIIISATANFLAGVAYANLGQDVRTATQNRELQAMQSAAEFFASWNLSRSQLQETVNNIMEGIPTVTPVQGKLSGQQFLKKHIPAARDIFEQEIELPVIYPVSNGHAPRPTQHRPDLPPNSED